MLSGQRQGVSIRRLVTLAKSLRIIIFWISAKPLLEYAIKLFVAAGTKGSRSAVQYCEDHGDVNELMIFNINSAPRKAVDGSNNA